MKIYICAYITTRSNLAPLSTATIKTEFFILFIFCLLFCVFCRAGWRACVCVAFQIKALMREHSAHLQNGVALDLFKSIRQMRNEQRAQMSSLFHLRASERQSNGANHARTQTWPPTPRLHLHLHRLVASPPPNLTLYPCRCDTGANAVFLFVGAFRTE